MTQIDPNMQVYQRLHWSNYLCIFYHSNSKEEHHFNIFELAVAQNPRESTATFLTGYGYWQSEGQALGYLVRSTIPAPRENVAVLALGNLLCPAKQGCRLSVLKELLHKNKMNCNRLEK